ncbi:carbohydrate sulfotransferase 13-like [Saccostrea cucullata]|uniref:carbohydrate sulfotransferase 13-like n=1 Tax=Saccostrea cuccullata TaxID=36930 RepID=UPI002ED49B87
MCHFTNLENLFVLYKYDDVPATSLTQSEYFDETDDDEDDDDENIYQTDDNDDTFEDNPCSTFPTNIFQTEMNFVQKQRREKVRNSCNRFHTNQTSRLFFNKLNNNIAFYDPLGFLYCRIQKVGSTFLRKTMKRLFSGIEHRVLQGKSILHGRSDDFIDCLAKSPKFMFVREPFGRALSGYVDKLFAPNPVYWKITGRHVVRMVRGSNASELSLKCGHDITFPEFMKYLIISQKSLQFRDRHFFPMHEHCFPCNINYDFIGKMETFREDVTFLLDSFNSAFDVELSFEDFEKESDLSIAKNQLARVFAFRTKTESCEPFHTSLLRFWRDLQIRGIIPIEVKMPFTSERAKNVSKPEVVDKITNIIQSIQNRTKLKEQRVEAKVEAFSQISKDIIKEYTELYHFDFELFDYQANLPFMKNLTGSNSNRLKYFDIFNDK